MLEKENRFLDKENSRLRFDQNNFQQKLQDLAEENDGLMYNIKQQKNMSYQSKQEFFKLEEQNKKLSNAYIKQRGETE